MKIKKFIAPVGVILLYFVLSSLEGITFNFIKTGFILKDNVFLIVFSSITLGIILYISRKKLTGELKDFKKNKNQYIPIAFRYWIYGFVSMFITNIIINIFILKGIAPNEAANREILYTYRYYSILSTALFAPIMEEIIFRLNFKGLFKNKNAFIIFTGVLFGAMHTLTSKNILDLLYIIPYSCLGIAFSKIYADTDNIFASIIAHIIHNSLTLLIILGGL